MLIDAASVARAWRAGEASEIGSAGDGNITIRTCERPQLLQRLLASIRERQARVGTRYRYHVLDDSKQEASRQRNREICTSAGGELALEYCDLQRDRLSADLKRKFPDACREIDWLLGATDGEAAHTYGRPVNHALLARAGERFLSIDDDVVLDVRQSPLQRDGFAISGARASFTLPMKMARKFSRRLARNSKVASRSSMPF